MESESKPIRGKVARILNSREVVLNIGTSNGVTPDMFFDILDPKCENITDPENHDILGSIFRPKVRVKVIEVQEKLSVAITFKKKTVNVGGRGSAFESAWADLLRPPKYITEYETLKTNEKTWEDLDEKDSYVKTGDPVIQVINAILEK